MSMHRPGLNRPSGLLIAAALLFFWPSRAHSAPLESVPTDSLRDRASRAMQAHRWSDAAAGYAEVARREPKNFGARSARATALYSGASYKEAAAAYREALALRPGMPTLWYNLACCEALTGASDSALAALDRAVARGFGQPDQMEGDTDLASLRGNPRFKTVVEASRKLSCPCRYQPEEKEFDFWVGEWEVRDPQGNLVGSSSVQKILGECIVFENWSGMLGMHGKSFNTYDQTRKYWIQTWVDDRGTVTEYRHGVYRDSVLSLMAESPQPDGSVQLQRLSFHNLATGQVRQVGEQSTDGGKTWAVTYDLMYTRKRS